MSAPYDSVLPSHYGQTTLSGHHVERPSVLGVPQLTQSTRTSQRVRPASMHWPPNRNISLRSSLPTTPTERSNNKGAPAFMLAQSSPSKVFDPSRLRESQKSVGKTQAARDYFGQVPSTLPLDRSRSTTTSIPVDPRTGREYALPPAAKSCVWQEANTSMSTPREKDSGEETPKTSSAIHAHAYSRSMSFYDAMKLKRAEAEAQAEAQAKTQAKTTTRARRGSSVSFCDAPVPMDEENEHGGHLNPSRPPVSQPVEHNGLSLRLPWTMWMNSTAKNYFVATLGEFVGTLMFLFLAFAGAEVANAGTKEPQGSSPITLLYISLSFSFSLMVNVWIFFRISGGLFNPAVTLALLLTGAIDKIRAVCLFLSQIVAGIAASGLVIAVFPAPFKVQTTLSSGTSIPRGLFIEALLTAELVFTILMLAKEKHRSTFIAPIGIGLALFVAELAGIFYTGGSLNPARSFGPCVVTKQFDSQHWIYWLGPLIGVFIAVAFYKFIKVLEYEMVNPGQDADQWNDPTKNPRHELRERQRDLTKKVLHSLGFEHLIAEEHEDRPAQATAEGTPEITSPDEKTESGFLASPVQGVTVCDPVGCRIEQRPITWLK